MAPQTVQIPVVGQLDESRSRNFGYQRTENLYAEVGNRDTKSMGALYSMPGLALAATIGSLPCRGNGVIFQGEGYLPVGNNLVRINSSGVASAIATFASSAGSVSMATGHTYLMIVDGTNGYYWDGSTLTTITDPDFPTCDYVCQVDQYYIVNERGTGKWWISAVNDPSNWSALSWTTAEAFPDNVKRVVAFLGRPMVIGEYSTEIYSNTGNVDFPFEPNPIILEYGTPAPDSIANGPEMLFALAQSETGGRTIVRVTGESPQTISTPALEFEMAQMADVSDSHGFAYQHLGRTFYQISFPSEGKSYCYDATSGLWQVRSTGDGRHRAHGHLFYRGLHYMGDYDNGNIYTLSLTSYTDNGTYIPRVRRFAYIHAERKLVSVTRLMIEFEQGVGLTTGQGSDPQAMLRYSTDGGHTFGNWMQAPIGKIGEYSTVSEWRRLGSGREFLFELRVTDPVEVTIINAECDVEVSAW